MRSPNTPSYQAATVNGALAPRTRAVKGSQPVQAPLTTLDARDLGRLINVVAGAAWPATRDVALINVMARAGLRVSEALALRSGHRELGPREGSWLVKAGKRLKARRPPLAVEARAALQANLKVRPQVADERLFLSHTLVTLDARAGQRLVSAAARRTGLNIKVASPMLRHSFVTKFTGWCSVCA